MIRSLVIGVVICLGITSGAAAQGAAARGEKLFVEQKCSMCHSVAGKGNVKGPLDGVGTKRTSEEIRGWITDAKGMIAKTKPTRKPDMKAYALAPDDVDALVAYLQTLKK
jgi:mono/diheme cytochrome c family protein